MGSRTTSSCTAAGRGFRRSAGTRRPVVSTIERSCPYDSMQPGGGISAVPTRRSRLDAVGACGRSIPADAAPLGALRRVAHVRRQAGRYPPLFRIQGLSGVLPFSMMPMRMLPPLAGRITPRRGRVRDSLCAAFGRRPRSRNRRRAHIWAFATGGFQRSRFSSIQRLQIDGTHPASPIGPSPTKVVHAIAPLRPVGRQPARC